jgi:hypothetical protein
MMTFPTVWKKNHVPNQQPDGDFIGFQQQKICDENIDEI